MTGREMAAWAVYAVVVVLMLRYTGYFAPLARWYTARQRRRCDVAAFCRAWRGGA